MHSSAIRRVSAPRQPAAVFQPRLEPLEDRLAPSVFHVMTMADSGPGSLRQAITDANTVGGSNTIDFLAAVNGTIVLNSALPTVTNNLTIDGPGASALTVERSTTAGTPAFGILAFSAGSTDAVSGLTIANGLLNVSTSSPTPPGLSGAGINNASTLTVSNCVLSGNMVVAYLASVRSPVAAFGGGIYNSGSLTVSNSTVSGNSVIGAAAFQGVPGTMPGPGQGGGIYNASGALNIIASTLSANTAVGGKGGSAHAFSTSGADGLGGGVYIAGGSAQLSDSTLSGNVAQGGMGGFGAETLGGNGGNGTGAGIFVAAGQVTVSNSTVVGNSSLGGQPGGGDVSNGQPGHGFGGGLANSGGTIRLADTIVGSNAATTGAPDLQGPFVSEGYNLFENPSEATFTGASSQDVVGVAPLLGPLQNNGGPTATQALLPESPAIDAGNPSFQGPPFTDQRGLPRIVNGRVDIGAYEVQANEPRSSGFTIAAASSAVVFAVTANAGLAVHQSGGWTTIGGAGTISSISALTDIHGNATVFAVTVDHALAEWSQNFGWQLLGSPGTILLANAGQDSSGLADVFVLTTATDLTEWSTSGMWLPRPIGGAGSVLSMAALNRDRVDVVTADHSIFRFDPQRGGWGRLTAANVAQSLGVAVDMAGNVTDFIVGMDQSLLRLDASSMAQLGAAGTVRSVSAGLDMAGRPDIFALTTANDFFELSSTAGWQQLGARNTIRTMSAADADTVFVVTGDQSVFEHEPSGWLPLSGKGFAQL